MEREFILGTRASCSDGECGEVTRTILDPATCAVTHLVVDPRHDRAAGRLVPVELVQAAAGEITLSCTIAEFGRLDPAEDVELAGDVDYGGGYGPSEAVQGYGNVGSMGIGGSVSGQAIGGDLGHHRPTVMSDAVPAGETEVARHDRVHAVDGEIGRLKGFTVDSADHRVTHVLLREGHLWGRKEVAIPVDAVASVTDGIRLKLTKEQVAELPPRKRG